MQIKKIPIIITLAAFTLLIILTAFFLRPQGKVTFALAPEEATLTINGHNQTIKNKQTISLSPGTYTLNVKRDHFSTESVSVTVKRNETLRTVVALDPQDDNAKKLISNNPESIKITQEYKSIQRTQLFQSLPLSGVNYSVESCKSVKYPQTDKKALCITSQTAAGEATAKLAVLQLGYDVNDYEVLTGASTLKTVMKSDSYKIETYANDPDSKPQLYITPLNVPYVSADTPRDEQLESIRTAALTQLEKEGYQQNNYTITFSNNYLSKYNVDPDAKFDGAGNGLD